MRILMCRPDYYGIEYAINPWMNIAKQVNHPLAVKQWESLYHTILACGAQIDLIEPVAGWPDMVFTANAGLYYKNEILLSHFKYKERQGELPYFKAWFEQTDFHIVNNPQTDTLFFEGAGDALQAGDQLFVGYGFRSERQFYEQGTFFNQKNLVYCELVNPYYYHLDTCFCPINESLAIWYPAAFTAASQKSMSANIELLAVEEAEAKQFACNAVVLGHHIILPLQCQQISLHLEKRGFKIHAQEMGEYLKAGGACKCLTLRID
ncbi:MAG: amidinotransferase [Gammaproteobacteria bacterium]|nr:amidinotransferase [Gammaproteobacteria bacterium]